MLIRLSVILRAGAFAPVRPGRLFTTGKRSQYAGFNSHRQRLASKRHSCRTPHHVRTGENPRKRGRRLGRAGDGVLTRADFAEPDASAGHGRISWPKRRRSSARSATRTRAEAGRSASARRTLPPLQARSSPARGSSSSSKRSDTETQVSGTGMLPQEEGIRPFCLRHACGVRPKARLKWPEKCWDAQNPRSKAIWVMGSRLDESRFFASCSRQASWK